MNSSNSSTANWAGDIFERKVFANLLTKILLDADTPFVLNLNSAWGTGKTFFLTRWKKDLELNHPVVYFNAWTSDFLDDPIPAFINAFNAQVVKHLPVGSVVKSGLEKITSTAGSLFTSVLPTVAKGIVQHYVGEEGTDAIFTIGGDDEKNLAATTKDMTKTLLTLQSDAENEVVKFRYDLEKIIPQIASESNLKSPVIILIDELDRCRPNFAIKFLEKIKHFFTVDNIIFVIATDTNQLAISFSAIYGANFDGHGYIKRFFDREYQLPIPNNNQFAFYLAKKRGYDKKNIAGCFPEISQPLPGIEYFAEIFSTLSVILSLTLRDQEQCFEKFHILQLNWNEAANIHIMWLLFLIMIHHKEPIKFYKMMEGRETENILNSHFNGIQDYESHGVTLKMIQNIQFYLQQYCQLFTTPFEQFKNLNEQHNRNYQKYMNRGMSRQQELEHQIIGRICSDYSSLKKYPIKINIAESIV